MANAPDPKDLCSKPECTAQVSSSNKSKSNKNENEQQRNRALDVNSVVNKAKGIIDSVFDPLAGKQGQGAYTNAGITKKSNVEKLEVSYEIVNLDPDNPYDVYYRDDDPKIWDRNRKSDTYEIRANIQDIHDLIVTPLRRRIANNFGDEVLLKIEYCFMCKNALIKHNYPLDHLFSKARAVMLYIENERASIIYNDILYWMDNEPDLEEDPKPQYGMLKLCNIEEERQRLYITLPFTDKELEQDELLLHNRSNFYYSESNEFKMLPESTTSTKIFPSYHADNNAEPLYTKVDDIEDEITTLNERIEQAAENKSTSAIKYLTKEKLSKEYELESTKNPKINSSKFESELEKLTQINSTLKNDDTQKALDDFKNYYEKFNQTSSTKPDEALSAYDKLEIDLVTDLEIPLDTTNYDIIEKYFTAKKLVVLKGIISVLSDRVHVIDEDVVNNKYNYLMSLWEAELDRRYNEKYNEKVVSASDASAYIPMNKSEIDMSDYPQPSKEEIRTNLLNEFDDRKTSLQAIYDEASTNYKAIEKLDEYSFEDIDTKSYFDSLSYVEKLELFKTECNKFAGLEELIKILDLEKNAVSVSWDPSTIYSRLSTKFAEASKTNKFVGLFEYLFDTTKTYDRLKEYFYEKIKTANNNRSDIEKVIEFSKVMNEILKRNNATDFILPSNNTKEYASYVMSYIDYEIEAHRSLNNTKRIDELTKIKEKYAEDISKEIYKNINIDEVKSPYYQFTELEFLGTKSRFLYSEVYEVSTDNWIEKKIPLKSVIHEIFNKYNQYQNLGWYDEVFEFAQIPMYFQIVLSEFKSLTSDDTFKQKVVEALFGENSNVSVFPNDVYESCSTALSEILNEFISEFNNYMTIRNKFSEAILYPDMNKYQLDEPYTPENVSNLKINIKLIELHKKFLDSSINYELIDYTSSSLELLDSIIKSKNIKDEKKIKDTDEDPAYLLKLKENRLLSKRDIDYLKLPDVDKRIHNFKEEAKIAAQSGKIGRYNQLMNVSIPETERLSKLKRDFQDLPNTEEAYLKMREAKTSEYRYISKLFLNNVWYLYRYVINDTKMDYENSYGLFSNVNMSQNEKYLLYLNELVRVLTEFNNRMLDPEIEAINKEIAYLKNENNEKKQKINEVIAEKRENDFRVSGEIRKRSSDKLYLHEVTMRTSIENELKLRYKDFIAIENLPSKGLKYIFPFKLFDEFKRDYLEVYYGLLSHDESSDIPNIQIIDAYRMYSKNFSSYEFDFERNVRKHKSTWTKMNYDLFTSPRTSQEWKFKLIEAVKTYKVIVNYHSTYDFEEYLGYCLRNVVGFLEYTTLPTSIEREHENISAILKLKIRRNKDFEDDLKLMLNNLYGVKPNVFTQYIHITDF